MDTVSVSLIRPVKRRIVSRVVRVSYDCDELLKAETTPLVGKAVAGRSVSYIEEPHVPGLLALECVRPDVQFLK